METVRLLTCSQQTDAYFIKGRLENNDIPCFFVNENASTLLPHYSNVMGLGIEVHVRDVDYSKASELVKDYIEPQNKELICPNCGSGNVRLGMGKYKGFKLFNMLIALILLIPVGHIKSKYYCKDCKAEIK